MREYVYCGDSLVLLVFVVHVSRALCVQIIAGIMESINH